MIFKYEAMTESQRCMSGKIEATSQNEAIVQLEKMGLTLKSIEKDESTESKSAIGSSEFLLFNQQLASIVKSGLPLERALRELAGDTASSKMKKVIKIVADDIESGMDIDQAFKVHEQHFFPLYSQVIRAGVKTGKLGEMLINLNRHLEIRLMTRRVFREATIYPLFLVGACFGIFVLFFMVMMPMTSSLHNELGYEPSYMMQLFYGVSDIFPAICIVLGGIVAMIIALWVCGSRSLLGRSIKERIILKIPVIGSLFRDLVISRFADSMRLLMSSGEAMPESLRLAAMSSGSELLISESKAMASHIEIGGQADNAYVERPFLPMLIRMGLSRDGGRDTMVEQMRSFSDMYSQMVKDRQGLIGELLSPVLIVMVGGFVGLACTAIFVPLIGMMDSIS